jgi:hypothetical protein
MEIELLVLKATKKKNAPPKSTDLIRNAYQGGSSVRLREGYANEKMNNDIC